MQKSTFRCVNSVHTLLSKGMGSNLISARKNIVYKHTGGDVVKKKNIIIIALSFLVVLILALLLGYGKKKEKDEKKQTLSQIKTNIESNKNNSDDDNSEITEEDVNTFSDFTDKFAEIEKTKYLNDNGYVDIYSNEFEIKQINTNYMYTVRCK